MTNEAANFTTIQVIFVSSVTVHVPEDVGGFGFTVVGFTVVTLVVVEGSVGRLVVEGSVGRLVVEGSAVDVVSDVEGGNISVVVV